MRRLGSFGVALNHAWRVAYPDVSGDDSAREAIHPFRKDPCVRLAINFAGPSGAIARASSCAVDAGVKGLQRSIASIAAAFDSARERARARTRPDCSRFPLTARDADHVIQMSEEDSPAATARSRYFVAVSKSPASACRPAVSASKDPLFGSL